MLENVTRHLENGETRLNAALNGAREVSFTVLSMSISLVAVFFPILLLGGLVGRIFHEFAITLTAAIAVSLIVSLTVTPMMCAYLAINPDETENGVDAQFRGASSKAPRNSTAAACAGRWAIPSLSWSSC